MARARGFNVNELVELVRRNEETMDLMRVRLGTSFHTVAFFVATLLTTLFAPVPSLSLLLLKENLRQKVIEDVIGIVIRSEKESSQRIDRVEAKLLALKITVKLEAYGITFDEDKFLHAVALNPTILGVAGTVRKLLPPDEEHGDDNISIVSDKDDIYDMFYMAREDQPLTLTDARAVSEGRHASLATRRHPAIESRQMPLSRKVISGRA